MIECLMTLWEKAAPYVADFYPAVIAAIVVFIICSNFKVVIGEVFIPRKMTMMHF